MKTKIILTALTLFTCFISLAIPPVDEGKAIFLSRCAACHSINKTLTGPALAGVHERYPIDWIVSFVQSSQTLVKSGNEKAIATFEKFNKIPMPDHLDLTGDNIKSIVEYIKSESEATAAVPAPFAKPSKLRPRYTPLSINNYWLFLGYFAAVVLLIVILLMAVQAKEFERNDNEVSSL
jgi:cytochrome c551/c552